jgi:hypothetical protein
MKKNSKKQTKQNLLLIQGDVLLKQVDSLPEGAVLVEAKAKILQQSETTGHHHQFPQESRVDIYTIPVDSVPGVATITDNKGKVIVVHEPTFLFHGRLAGDHSPQLRGTGDHSSVEVPPGTYVVDIVREYDYEYNQERRVRD